MRFAWMAMVALLPLNAHSAEYVNAQFHDSESEGIVVANEVYKDYPAHEDHFKTAQWGHFSGIMEKYPPRSIDVKTYDASETKHALDD